jgi:hypothetical protein
MWVNEPGSAKNTLNTKWVETLQTNAERFGNTLQFAEQVEVETITLEELIRTYGRPFYIKIDVEGHEAKVLRGLKSVVPFVSFEVNLPEFKPEAIECAGLLEQLSQSGRFNYTVDCRAGMASPVWLEYEAFLRLIDSCKEPSIEVFWRAVA